MNQKPFYQSKTLWMNLLMAIVAFIPPAKEFITNNPEVVSIGFVVINMVLRLITKDELQLT